MLLFFGAALFLAFLVANGPATADALLQSPQSPPPAEEPQPEPPSPTPPPPSPTPLPPSPTPAPPEPAEPEPAIQEQAVETASTEAIQAEPTPVEPPPAEPPAEPTPTPLPAIVEPQASGPQPVGPQPEPLALTQEEIPLEADEGGASNFILDQIELIDAIAVSGAYVWLCCGVGMLLLLPLFLLILYVRGRSRILQEESYY